MAPRDLIARLLGWAGIACMGCGRVGFDARAVDSGIEQIPSSPGTLAVFAECIALTAPDPDTCAKKPAIMTIDQWNTSYSQPVETAVFMRFEPEARDPVRPISSVTLTVHLSPSPEQGDDSGEIWLVDCFTREELFAGVPQKRALLAPSLGSLPVESDAVWSLPPSMLAVDQPTCLGVFSLGPDGTDFDNLAGAKPPRLGFVTEE